MNIKNLPRHEQPREKLIEKGAENLKNNELLAILLGTGRQGRNVLEVAQEILRKYPMKKFLNKIIDNQLTKYKLNKLSLERFQVKEAIENHLNKLMDKITSDNFKELEDKKALIADKVFLELPEKLKLLNCYPDNFTKHLFVKAAPINKEEADLAFKLNSLDNIKWWFRNPEEGGFYIQGWLKQKFYPDFIVKTKNNNYFVLEYKGLHLKGSKDTTYKEAVGKKWEELSKDNYYFEMVDSRNVNKVLERIEKL